MRKLLCVGLLLASVASARAQVWEKKEYREWSEADCKKMLEDSPWAQKFGIAEVRQQAFVRGEHAQDSRAEVDFIARLQSALPVRQAVIRLAMIQNKYDKMSAEQKKAFDESAEKFLGVPFDNRVVIQVHINTNVTVYQRELERYWSGVRTEAIPVNVYLIGKNGRRVMPVRFIPPTGGNLKMEFTFPRQAAEGPLVDETDKTFMLELPGLQVGEIREPRVLFQFKPEKMKFKGTLAY